MSVSNLSPLCVYVHAQTTNHSPPIHSHDGARNAAAIDSIALEALYGAGRLSDAGRSRGDGGGRHCDLYTKSRRGEEEGVAVMLDVEARLAIG